MSNEEPLPDKILHTILGKPRNIRDPRLFRKIALIPLLAWIGLGADGISSSSYGPEAAFRALGEHTYLAVWLALATALTVFVISYAYSRIIEHFPSGGGGYIVSTKTLGEKAGVVSGSALLVDYVLTITVSIVACGDAVFSFFPAGYAQFKIPFEIAAVIFLIILNLRGVKESVTFLAPIFIIFVLTHALLIGYGILRHVPDIVPVAQRLHADYTAGLATLGAGGLLLIFLRAFSMGAGTYTGIEAVANGIQGLREPRVQNGKRTMVYMSSSLALTAGGILLCYLLLNVQPVLGKTLNAVLADGVFGGWAFGSVLALITIFSEGALLFVAAQTGFVGGPQIMANMAADYWFPRRFASLSDRFTIQNGVLLMGGAAVLLILYSRGSITTLVVMYSINVFLDFSLAQLGMSRYSFRNRRREIKWKKNLAVHLVGLILCLTILVVMALEKFYAGGWLTLLITATVIGLCLLTRAHYQKVRQGVREMDELLTNLPVSGPVNSEPVDPGQLTAIQLVNGYNGFGVHTMLTILQNFHGLYRNFIFVSVAEVDVGSFKSSDAMAALKAQTSQALQKYVNLARKFGLAADYRFDMGTDIVETACNLCETVAKEFPKSAVFAGQAVFRNAGVLQKLLHNETGFAIQQELRWKGIMTIILPIRINI